MRGPVFYVIPPRNGGAVRLAAVLSSAVAGGGWAQSQLITADQLSADTLRLHIRADTDSVRDQSAKLAVRDAVLGPHRRSLPGKQPGRCPGVGGGKPRPLRADGPPDTGLSRHPRTGESLPREYVLSHPAL